MILRNDKFSRKRSLLCSVRHLDDYPISQYLLNGILPLLLQSYNSPSKIYNSFSSPLILPPPPLPADNNRIIN